LFLFHLSVKLPVTQQALQRVTQRAFLECEGSSGEIDMKQLSLSERIAQRVQSTKTNRARNNLLAFLALRDDIKQALNDSYTKK
jgi:hypothetical protein